MRPVHLLYVHPRIPERLRALEQLAYNLRWSWNHETISLFRRLDRDLWETTGHNPVLMLGTVAQARMEEAAQDEAFLAHLDRCAGDLERYLGGAGAWYARRFGAPTEPLVAYFSMEFGISECLPIYSGGLGILAGDHLKSTSDLGVPLIGVGLLYQKGYFRQYLSHEGWQHERYPVNDFYNMPIRPWLDVEGRHTRVEVDLAGERTVAQLWRANVGRVTLVLLDTNTPENPKHRQDLTDELYGGDGEMRIQQEIVLGIGGMRALKALGLRLRVYHMNEGHSAFVGLERIRLLMKAQRLSFHEAFEVVQASTVFTTHTSVPAGIDVFPVGLMDKYFAAYCAEVGLGRDAFLDLGRFHAGDGGEPFNMAVLAMRSSGFVNGVSRLHGQVSRNMWKDLWPGVPVDELPITHVTNGVHPGSWVSEEMNQLYSRYLGPRWAEEPGEPQTWARAEQIPGEELWRTHERRRERLVAFVRRRLVSQLKARGAGAGELALAEEALDPEALTLGFARRFATYKRGTLLLRDPERLERILNAPGRPVQIVYAGKAHPRDEGGKSLIREIVRLTGRPEFRRRIVFLEDYDQTVARYMVQGVDVWLNTPRRPLEASGTSGMKAALNGALNLSILDGWWDEAYTPDVGWAIGNGEEYQDLDYQDRLEAATLYDLLERDVVPLFYTRGADGLPRGWVERIRSAVAALCSIFNTNRMVHDYTVAAYHPARDRRERLEAGGFERARLTANWRQRIRDAWRQVEVRLVEADWPANAVVGDAFDVRARVHLGPLAPGDVAVQAYYGRINEHENIVEGHMQPMTADEPSAGGSDGVLFRAPVIWHTSGRQGLTVRVLPHHPDLGHPHQAGLIAWAR
ncbi:MAG: alpha-glucan family phosphorylase [Planctomycetes bacterium]|nr:alpha-glucan family phosphorylase [Planctomycetota bacterium]